MTTMTGQHRVTTAEKNFSKYDCHQDECPGCPVCEYCDFDEIAYALVSTAELPTTDRKAYRVFHIVGCSGALLAWDQGNGHTTIGRTMFEDQRAESNFWRRLNALHQQRKSRNAPATVPAPTRALLDLADQAMKTLFPLTLQGTRLAVHDGVCFPEHLDQHLAEAIKQAKRQLNYAESPKYQADTLLFQRHQLNLIHNFQHNQLNLIHNALCALQPVNGENPDQAEQDREIQVFTQDLQDLLQDIQGQLP